MDSTKNPKWYCGNGKCDCDYDDYDYDGGDYMPMMPMDDCCMPKMPCKMEKKCVKTFTSTFKLYRICHYRLYKVCPRCRHEYDYHRYGMCPKCMKMY